MIEVNNIHKSFRSKVRRKLSHYLRFKRRHTHTVLSDLSLTIPKNTRLGIIGSNGSGKTTLLRIIADIYTPDKGSIHTQGKIVPFFGIQGVMHDNITLWHNTRIALALLNVPRDQLDTYTQKAIDYAQLEDYRDEKFSDLSPGLMQRICFAIGLQAKPEILLLDEIFSATDQEFRDKAMTKIKQLNATCVMVSHDLEFLEQHVDQIAWLKNGKIDKKGPPQQIIAEYRKSR